MVSCYTCSPYLPPAMYQVIYVHIFLNFHNPWKMIIIHLIFTLDNQWLWGGWHDFGPLTVVELESHHIWLQGSCGLNISVTSKTHVETLNSLQQYWRRNLVGGGLVMRINAIVKGLGHEFNLLLIWVLLAFVFCHKMAQLGGPHKMWAPVPWTFQHPGL